MRADKQYDTLLRMGFLPTVAAEASRLTGEPRPNQEAENLAAIRPADIERARVAWYFSAIVPEPMRRILDARS